jgi:hypothetical protein
VASDLRIVKLNFGAQARVPVFVQCRLITEVARSPPCSTIPYRPTCIEGVPSQVCQWSSVLLLHPKLPAIGITADIEVQGTTLLNFDVTPFEFLLPNTSVKRRLASRSFVRHKLGPCIYSNHSVYALSGRAYPLVDNG